ncbi:MAG: hypothetical protein GF311_21465 [Candidatus Lokiarchaeota archaeon]|nr:hypothetical protein [Candidatus Lokiarchaeota archaeon]
MTKRVSIKDKLNTLRYDFVAKLMENEEISIAQAYAIECIYGSLRLMISAKREKREEIRNYPKSDLLRERLAYYRGMIRAYRECLEVIILGIKEL